jgi:hypothetical protein
MKKILIFLCVVYSHTLFSQSCIDPPIVFFKQCSLNYSDKIVASETLKDTSERLNWVVKQLQKDSLLQIQINSHCNNNEYLNDSTLSYKRAIKVQLYLIQNGIEADRISIRDYKNHKPLISYDVINKTKSRKEKIALLGGNCRVTFLFK